LHTQGGRQGENTERKVIVKLGVREKPLIPVYSAHKRILRGQLERPYLKTKVLRKALGVDQVVQRVSHHAWIPAFLHNTAQKGKS
jgi:hypothetical protein